MKSSYRRSSIVVRCPLKLEPALAGAICQSLDPAVVGKTSTIENDGLDTGCLRSLAYEFANGPRRIRLAVVFLAPTQGGVKRRRRYHSTASIIIDNLGVDMVQAAIDGHTGPLGRAVDMSSYTAMAASPGHPRGLVFMLYFLVVYALTFRAFAALTGLTGFGAYVFASITNAFAFVRFGLA